MIIDKKLLEAARKRFDTLCELSGHRQYNMGVIGRPNSKHIDTLGAFYKNKDLICEFDNTTEQLAFAASTTQEAEEYANNMFFHFLDAKYDFNNMEVDAFQGSMGSVFIEFNISRCGYYPEIVEEFEPLFKQFEEKRSTRGCVTYCFGKNFVEFGEAMRKIHQIKKRYWDKLLPEAKKTFTEFVSLCKERGYEKAGKQATIRKSKDNSFFTVHIGDEIFYGFMLHDGDYRSFAKTALLHYILTSNGIMCTFPANKSKEGCFVARLYGEENKMKNLKNILNANEIIASYTPNEELDDYEENTCLDVVLGDFEHAIEFVEKKLINLYVVV